MSDNPEETAYFLRIISLFIDVATETVLKAFYYHIPEQDPAQFLSSSDVRKKVSQLLKDKAITTVQYNLLSAHVPDAGKFDISLLITLLINTNLLPPPQKGWESRPRPSDLSLSADLLRLRNIRNSIVAHKPKAALYKEKFELLWKELEDILIRVGERTEPDSSEGVAKRIEFYRSRSLDVHDESKYRQQLEEWWEEISKLQEKVEELVKKCNEFILFFKETPEKYSRYVKLLFEGGRFVLSNLLTKGLSEQGYDLRTVLLNKRDVLESSIVNSDLISQVFETDNANSVSVNSDIQTWDITVLAVVIEVILKPEKLKEIKIIKDARHNYADTALLITLDNESFSACCEDLVYSIRTLSSVLDEEIQLKCEEQIKRYRTRSADDKATDFDDYLNRLKSHGTGIKSLSDLYKETTEKLKEAVKQMKDAEVSFSNAHVLDLKMVTLGGSSEKKKFADDTLHTVWQTALCMSENPHEFDAVRREVDKILEEIRNIPDVEPSEIKRHCILLSIKCFSSHGLLQALDYLTGDIFKNHLASLSKEYFCDEVMKIEGNITFESLNKILESPQGIDEAPDEELSLPIICSSVEGMEDVLKLLGSEKITNSINEIADSLSSHVAETISLKVVPDLKGLSCVFDETDNETSSSSESQTDEKEYSDRYTEEKSRDNEGKSSVTQDTIDTTVAKENEKATDDYAREKAREVDEKPNSESKSKEAFKKDLITLYRKRHATLPIGLNIEDDKPLEKLYVPPYPLYDVSIQASTEITPINSLYEMFLSRENVCRNIYLTAETGMGKTAFIKWLTLCWCQAHDNDKGTDDNYVEESIESIEEMKQFEFLFTVSVGELKVDRYHVDDMIYYSIVCHIGDVNNYNMKFVENILEQGKCLIILDGIDEHISKGSFFTIPDRTDRDGTSTLTTCTTWTYERLRLYSPHIDKHVRIGQLESSTAETISRNIISLFSEETRRACREFKKELLDRNMDHLISSPVLLTHLLSLWISENTIDSSSQCELYTQMVLLLVGRASLTEAFAQQLLKFETKDLPLLECIENFKPYHPLFTKLGHLAFYTLFGSPTERHFIFEETEAEEVLSLDDEISPLEVLNAGFITGILRKQDPQEYFRKKYSISFIHKSVHEFLAALFISTFFTTKDIIKTVKTTCTSVSAILEFRVVFMFLSGFNEEIARDILLQMQQVIDADEVIQKYRCNVSTGSMKQIKNIQDMIVNCAEESRNSGRGQLQLPLEDVVVGYFCEKDSYEPYLRRLLKTNSNDIQSIRVEGSVSQRSLVLDKFEPRTLQKLSIEGLSGMQAIPSITGYETLRYIHLECMSFESYSNYWDLMIALIHLPLIEALGLVNIDMTHGQLSDILQYLNGKTNLTQIVLKSIQCKSHSETCLGLLLNLTRHGNLRLLDINEVPVTNVHVNPESLIDCKIGCLPDNTSSSVFYGLEKASNLQNMICDGLSANSDIDAMTNVLPWFSNLVCLDLSFIDFGERIIHFPSEMNNFAKLNMFSITMSDKALRGIIESIQAYRQAVTMELTICSVVPKIDFEQIKSNIRSSSKFTVLDDIDDEIFNFKTSS